MPPAKALTVEQLAAALDGRLEGDGGATVARVAPLGEAGPDAVAWLGAAKYADKLAQTRAAVVLVPPECAAPPGQAVIRVADPDLAMVAAQRLLAPPTDVVPPGVHPTAVVAADAEAGGAAIGPYVAVGARSRIGPGTQLHAGVVIGSDVTIGDDCVLWPGVVVRERVQIGARVVIHPNATIGADGFGYLQRDGVHVKIPQVGAVVIEDDVEIGANTCIDRARSGETRIGAGTKIDNLVQIGHNVRIGPGCVIVAQCGVSGSTALGRYVVLAGQVGVSDHLRIGDMVQVAAQSGVTHDLSDKTAWMGTPAVQLQRHHRQFAALKKLPEMHRELRALRKRIEELESSTHD